METIIKFFIWLSNLDNVILKDIIFLIIGIVIVIICANFLNENKVDDTDIKREFIEPKSRGGIGSIAKTMINNYYAEDEENGTQNIKRNKKNKMYLIATVICAVIGLAGYIGQEYPDIYIVLLVGGIIILLIVVILVFYNDKNSKGKCKNG